VKLFTIGYEHAGQRAFVHTLRDAGVATVIDVRELPLSRRAGFSKGTLAAALAAAGLGYVHLKALGTPKEGRIANRRRDWPRFWSIVDAQLATPEADAAFEHAARIARSSPSCLLCLEADATVCHRSRVAAEMARRYGFTVRDLTLERSLA
jgi:uncharacterized protein (DUF488 family)